MRATADEMRRGILSWHIAGRASFRVGVLDPATGTEHWSSPVNESSGSKVDSPPWTNCRLQLTPLGDIDLGQPFRVRFERLVNHVVLTRVWEGNLERQPVTLWHIPNFGVFHRLVVAVPGLDWGDDVYFASGEVRVRFVTGEIEGERAGVINRIEEHDGQFSMVGDPSGTHVADGRFIDIVAPGSNREDAELHAYAVLGLVTLALGELAVGDIVFTEAHEASVDGQRGSLHIPVTARLPRWADTDEVGPIEHLLPMLFGSERVKRARVLALRWFERGGRAMAPLDQLLSWYIGIETLVNTFAAEHGPVASEIQREERFNELLARLASELDHATFSRVRQRMLEATVTERFAFYVERHGLQAELVTTFRTLSRTRSEAVHGNPIDVNREQANNAKMLLTHLLKASLGLVGAMPWEQHPHISDMWLNYRLVITDRPAT